QDQHLHRRRLRPRGQRRQGDRRRQRDAPRVLRGEPQLDHRDALRGRPRMPPRGLTRRGDERRRLLDTTTALLQDGLRAPPHRRRQRRRNELAPMRSHFGAPLALALLTAAGAASAQDAPSAQALRDKARASLSSGDTAGACTLFEQSYQAAKGAPGAVSPDEVLFELADCHEKLGKKAVAATEFDQVVGPKADEAKKRAAALKGGQGPAAARPAAAACGGSAAAPARGAAAAAASDGADAHRRRAADAPR